MSDVTFAQELFEQAWTEQRYPRVKDRLYVAWRFMKPKVEPQIDRPFTLRRVRALANGESRRIDGAEINALKQAVIEGAKREQEELRKRLSSLDEILTVSLAEQSGEAVEAQGAPTYRRGAPASGQGEETGADGNGNPARTGGVAL